MKMLSRQVSGQFTVILIAKSDIPDGSASYTINQMVDHLYSHFDFSFVLLSNMIRCKDFCHKMNYTLQGSDQI